MSSAIGLILIVCSALVAFGLTGLLRRYALQAQILDIPNQRSSHTVPTPRGGGLAVAAAFCLCLLVAGAWGLVLPSLLMAAVGGGSAVAAIGFVDDRGHVPARWRLLVHFLAAAWAVAWLGGMPALPIGGYATDLGAAGVLAAIFLTVWLLNLYNFMDGIDGLAGVETVTVAAGAALLLLFTDQPAAAVGPALLAAAGSGFLFWNWPPARIFMGDAGSGFIGFVLAVFALSGALSFWSWLILLGVFLVDASYTLSRRLLRGERVYEAHRSHAYQRAARRHGAHRPVTLAVALINVVWLWPWAFLAQRLPELGLLMTVIAWLPLLALAVMLGAGESEELPA